jgi:hypothetical protein
MRFTKLRKYIESKRESRNVFFVIVVFIKDFLWWRLYVGFFSRLLFYIYSKFLFKDKYGLVFVICKYKEDIRWLKNFPYKYIVYDRNDVKDKNYDDGLIDYSKTLKLKNIGKDGFSILTFIIDNYDSLPSYIGFLQGQPFDHSPSLASLIYKFKGQGYYGLSPRMSYRKNQKFEFEYLKIIEKTTLKYFGVKRDIFEFPFGMQFIVSKDKILKHSIDEYKFLKDKLEELENIDSGCIDPLHPKKPCPCLHDVSAWMLEVWWPIFFGEDKNLIF